MRAMTLRTRFAPSPTGQLHVGNARTALFSALLAAQAGGEFILRIEDTDAERSRSEFETVLLADLAWLGLHWQEGPDVGGPHAPYRQSERSRIYRTFTDKLAEHGRTYPCFCTPAELALARKTQLAAGQPPRYAGTCAGLTTAEIESRLAQGMKPALRFRVPEKGATEFDDLIRGAQRFAHKDIGDFVIRRADGSPAFFFSNAVDDAVMGITHVLRGEDHLANTPRQLLLLQALGLHTPHYAHLSLLVGADGKPLSKREGGGTLRELQEMGFSSAAVKNYLARLGHHYETNQVMNFRELAEGFDVFKLNKSPAHYDLAQLRHWQKVLMSEIRDAVLWQDLTQSKEGTRIKALVPNDKWREFITFLKQDIKHSLFPAEAADYAGMLYSERLLYNDVAEKIIRKATEKYFSVALELLPENARLYRQYADFLSKVTGLRGRDLYMPLRVALTGITHGPELDLIWTMLGPERIHRRLTAAAEIARN
ncbi:MAG TPA: glutamate--tRNA ligase [Gammaproteobacteria bacterium]|nr:glutamate--tRNA ligase [Gammaproteobacteria bacterium]